MKRLEKVFDAALARLLASEDSIGYVCLFSTLALIAGVLIASLVVRP